MPNLCLLKSGKFFIAGDDESSLWFGRNKDGNYRAVINKISENKQRELYQNKWLWSLNTDLSNQVFVAGNKYSPEAWHEQMKRQFLPETCEKGVDKWDYLPNGDRILKMSSTDLNIQEFRLYGDVLEAYAVTEFGVAITDRSRKWEE